MSKRLWNGILVVTLGALLSGCPGGPSSEEELKVESLAAGFTAATTSFLKAARTMGGLGMDTTSDAEDAVIEIKKIRGELTALMRTLAEDQAIRKAGELKAKIDDFCRKNDIE